MVEARKVQGMSSSRTPSSDLDVRASPATLPPRFRRVPSSGVCIAEIVGRGWPPQESKLNERGTLRRSIERAALSTRAQGPPLAVLLSLRTRPGYACLYRAELDEWRRIREATRVVRERVRGRINFYSACPTLDESADLPSLCLFLAGQRRALEAASPDEGCAVR